MCWINTALIGDTIFPRFGLLRKIGKIAVNVRQSNNHIGFVNGFWYVGEWYSAPLAIVVTKSHIGWLRITVVLQLNSYAGVTYNEKFTLVDI